MHSFRPEAPDESTTREAGGPVRTPHPIGKNAMNMLRIAGRSRMSAWPVLALVALLCSCAPRKLSDISLERCLEGQRTVAVPSADRAVSGMISSYDRLGGNIDWADLKACWIGGDRYVFADLKGPGCVKRLWMTNVNAEEWLFYFDGESEPRIRMAERDLFAIDKPGLFPFVHPLADAVSGGSFCYIPFPYQQALKIVVRIPGASANARPYYHVNYETYPPGTRVESFPKKLSDRQKGEVEKTLAAWNGVEDAMRAVARRLEWTSLTASPGGTATVWQADARPGTVQTLAIRLGAPAGPDAVQRDRLLRHLVLRCFWDGASVPSVEVPLGDFFCNGLHPRRFASLPMANIDGTMLCRFPMPFRTGARIEIRNDGPFAVPFQAAVERTDVPPVGSLYFHAAFNQAVNAGMPLRVMRTEGKGAFMGCYLIALGMDGGWNILEGDEKFFRDGELRPVHHGTGLEDYFNSGWYYYGHVERPFHGLLEKAAMRTAQYRFQIPDPVTFEKSLMMQFEFGDGNRAKGYMSAASYWYQDTPGPSGSAIPEGNQRFPPPDRVGTAASMCELFELERAGLAREAEERSEYYAALFGNEPIGRLYALRALAYREIREGAAAVRAACRETAETPGMAPEVAEQARLLLWRGEDPKRALFGGCAYSAYRLFVDDRKVGEGGNPFVYQAFPVELTPGSHMLRVEIDSRGDQSWYALGFFSDFTNVVSDVSWDYALVKPEGWPAGDGDPALWKPYELTPWFFPNMQWWQFAPNAFPGVQSGQAAGGPVGGWQDPPGRTIFLRRRITVPAEPGPRCNPFVRRKEIRTPSVRPAGDTSNEGLIRGKDVNHSL